MSATAADWSAFYDGLHRYVRSRVRVPADADDLVQVILERAMTKEAARSSSGSASAWLFAIARNAIHDHYRSKPRTSPTDPEALENAGEEASLWSDADRALVLACMNPLLASLPADAQQLLRWADMEDRPVQRIAQDLGISLTAAKSRVQRARAEFRKATRHCCAITVDARRRLTAFAPKGSSASNCSPCASTPSSRLKGTRHDC
jgi:RNA polymerase sigma-70 factor, ECF subfamily